MREKRIDRFLFLSELDGAEKEPRCSNILLVYHEYQNWPIKPELQLTSLVRKLLTLEQQMALASKQAEWPSWMLQRGRVGRNPDLLSTMGSALIQLQCSHTKVHGGAGQSCGHGGVGRFDDLGGLRLLAVTVMEEPGDENNCLGRDVGIGQLGAGNGLRVRYAGAQRRGDPGAIHNKATTTLSVGSGHSGTTGFGYSGVNGSGHSGAVVSGHFGAMDLGHSGVVGTRVDLYNGFRGCALERLLG
ncbi:hypothetical protein E1301_Tti006657 [Triplophysa tibetana]|uniref:Uncharacterized protein n=1 Tax=Triplophysa tibetana TaxID=1572043 RepID=A0A5A9PBH1_9TELE|nr:hypothetical protein E1301_Tti006657 [Triplophysa tibetana]